MQSTLESGGHGGPATAPTVPELDTDALDTTLPAGTDDQAPSDPGATTPAGTDTEPGDTTPAGTDTEPDSTTPAGTDDDGANTPPTDGDTDGATDPASTGDPDSPTDDATAPQNNAPDTELSPSNPNDGAPSPDDSAPSTPDDSVPSTPDGSVPSIRDDNGPVQVPAAVETTTDGHDNADVPTIPSPGDTAPSITPTGSTTDLPPQSLPTDPTDTDPANNPPVQQVPTTLTPNDVTQPGPTTPANPPTTQPTTTDTSTAATTTTPAPQTGTPTPTTTAAPSTTTPSSTPTTPPPPLAQTPTSTTPTPSPRSTTTPPATTTTPPTPAPNRSNTNPLSSTGSDHSRQGDEPTQAGRGLDEVGQRASLDPPKQSGGQREVPPSDPESTPPESTTPADPQASQPNSIDTPTTVEAAAAPTTAQNAPLTPTPTPTPTTPDSHIEPGHSPDARPLRDSLRNLPSQDGRITTVDTNRDPSQSRPPAYRIRRFQVGGQWVAVATIRAYIPNAHLMTPAELHQEMEYAHAAIDATFNHNRELPGGDRLLVDVEFSTNPNATDLRLNTQQHRFDLANDLREHMGLPPGKPEQPPTEDDLCAISNDIARANTPAPFSNPSDLRTFGPRELAPVEQARFQSDVENALRSGNEFTIGADPRTNPYGSAINDGGPTVRGRRNNCLDCSLSALSSFYGRPQVAAPRNDDKKPDGTSDTRTGEASGLARAAQWLGGGLLHFKGLSIGQQYQALHDHVAALGPGSSALVVNRWHAQDAAGNFLYNDDGSPKMGGSHATVIVYPPGATGPVWWDPQSGMTSDTPPSWMVDASLTLDFTPIDPNGGNPHGGTNSHGGSSQTVAGPMVRTEPGIQHDGNPARLGQPSDTDGSGTRAGLGAGLGELRSEQADRSDHRTPQPPTEDDRRGVRPGDRDGAPDTGRPGVPPASPDQPSTDLRGPEHGPVRDAGDLARTSGHPDHQSDPDNHQEPVQLSPDRQSGGLGGVLGGSPLPSDGSLADGGQLRAVDSQPDETPSTTTAPTSTQTASPQPVPSTGLPNAPGAAPHPAASSATPPPPASSAPTPQQVQNANRARVARDNLRTRRPDGGVQPVTDPSGRRRFTWGRYTTALGAPVSVMRIGIHLTGAANLDPAAVAALLERAQFAVDLHFNGGFRLPNGDWMMVDLVPVTNPADADMHMPVDSSGLPGTTHPNVDLPGLTAQLRDQLGLDPNGDHVSPADLDQLSAAVDRARFTLPPPPWLSNPSTSNTESEPPRPTTPTSLPNTRNLAAHPVPDNSRHLPPPPRRDFRAPESNPPPRPTLPTSAPTSQAPRPVDSTTPHSAPHTPHDPHSWGAPNPNHRSRTGGRRPLWRRILGLPPRDPAASASVPPATPSTVPPPTTRHAAEFRPQIAPPAPQQVVDEFGARAYRPGPPFQTQNMGQQYDGEHIPGNQVWQTPPSHVDYLDPNRRRALRLEIRNGLLYTANGELFDTGRAQTVWSGGGRAIFVMDQNGNLYASLSHSAGRFHHSSFLAGAPVAAAGELVVSGGVLQLLTDSSGHYRPERGHTLQAIEHLRRLGIPLSAAQVEFEAPR
ncbi:toxin glutamine deamidase domain-containing protein [Nocardia sp. MW-W600-9]